MGAEKYREEVLKRIAVGHWHILKKAVPKKKSPTGKAIPAVKERVPSCKSGALFGRGLLKRTGMAEPDANDELRKMRDEGIIHCTNKMWWKR